MSRLRLPNRRVSENVEFEHAGHAFVATVSRSPDGRLAEIFLDAVKSSSSLADAARDAAILASLALQSGCPVAVLRHSLSRNSDNEAAGPLGAALDLIEVSK